MAAAIAELPVAALRLPVETVDALRRLGVERIGQLAAMPNAPLTRRFGPDVRRRLDQALGHAAEPFDALIPPEIIRRRLAFAEPIGSREALSGVVTRLCGDLCSDLAAKALGVRRLDLVFGRVDRASQAVQVKTARPNRDPAHLARLLADRLDFIDPGFGIEDGLLIASRVEPLAPKQTSAQGLSGDDAETNLGPLVDRLTTRLGEAKVYRQAPVESDLPERSVARVPALAPNAGLTWPPALPRPPRLLGPPEPIEVMALVPDYPPAAFVWRRVRRRVVRADGPERVFGEWWRADDERSAMRDYYRLEAADGSRYWVFRDGPAVEGVRWFLHGLFA